MLELDDRLCPIIIPDRIFSFDETELTTDMTQGSQKGEEKMVKVPGSGITGEWEANKT